jgi:starch-binding outer membrane protein, SusD/RagB family
MNKMKTKIYLSLLIALFLGVSCNKDLTQLPTDSVSDEQIFSSVDAAQTALNAGHRSIGHYQNHTLGYIMADVMGEDALMTSGAYGRPTYNWNVFSYTYSQVPTSTPWWSGYSNYIWPLSYKAIDAANSIIKYVAELPESAKRDDLIAKAHGLRGYAYLYLIRLFAPAYTLDKNAQGVILRLEPANAASDHLPRATVEDIYKQVINDLTFALNNITDNNVEFITPRSAALLLARAYLDMADYTNAKKYAEFAANNIFDGSNLMSQEEWKSGFKERNSEWLWAHFFTPATCNIFASVPSFYYHASGYKGYPYGGKVDIDDMLSDKAIDMWDGYGTVRFTKAFVSKFEDKDCRKRFPFYFYEEDGYFTSKFNHRTMMGDAEFPMARIAEAYLIKAECEVHLGGDAAAPLNALQVKRGATTTAATLENIYLERRKELYGEGHRLHDIRRLHIPLIRTTSQEHWAKVDLPADSPRLMLPIPENEMLFNKKLEAKDQNEYWR